MVCCMSYFHVHVFVSMISCLLSSYTKILAMWLVREFFRFSKEVFLLFFLATSNWYQCVLLCISRKESPFVPKKLTSGKPALSLLITYQYDPVNACYTPHACSHAQVQAPQLHNPLFTIPLTFNAVNHMISLKQPHLFILTFLSKVQAKGLA